MPEGAEASNTKHRLSGRQVSRYAPVVGISVCAGAQIQCSQGTLPSILGVLPIRRTQVSGRPAGTIADNVPLINVAPFGLCTTLANPAVAAATAAALGVLIPMPCIPIIPSPWAPGSPTVLIGGTPALNNMSTCQCAYGGLISILIPGQLTTTA
jgi:hypothetical protein